MSVFEIGKDRYRVQVRRKGFPTYDQVFANRKLAEAAQAKVLGEQTQMLSPGDLTLSEAWERYCDSVDFSRKSDSTQKTELAILVPPRMRRGRDVVQISSGAAAARRRSQRS